MQRETKALQAQARTFFWGNRAELRAPDERAGLTDSISRARDNLKAPMRFISAKSLHRNQKSKVEKLEKRLSSPDLFEPDAPLEVQITAVQGSMESLADSEEQRSEGRNSADSAGH